MDDPNDLRADEIFGPLSQPARAATKAARQVIAGETVTDLLRDMETSIASEFAVAHADRLKYDQSRSAWFVCGPGSIWRPDRDGEAARRVQDFLEQRAIDQIVSARNAHDETGVRAACRRLLSNRGVHGILNLATHQRALATDGVSWNRNPLVLATADGELVDLRNGHRRATEPADFITRAAAVPLDASGACDRFRRFVREVTNDDRGLAQMLTRALGYTLTGATSEQCFFILLGGGSNGKTTLLELMAYLLGDLAGLLPFHVLTRVRNENAVQAEFADLPGLRFVRASEVRDGAHIDEGRIKAISGEDEISAAKKYCDPIRFRPVCKLWLGLNHRPRVSDRSHGFWRRVRLLPFERQFAIDPHLEAALRAEGPAILAYLAGEAVEWFAHRLPAASTSNHAAAQWRADEDIVAQWAAGALAKDASAKLRASHAFGAFRAWAVAEAVPESERPGSRGFGEWMTDHFAWKHDSAGKYYCARLLPMAGDGSGVTSTNSLPRVHAGRKFQEQPPHPSPTTRTTKPGGFDHV